MLRTLILAFPWMSPSSPSEDTWCGIQFGYHAGFIHELAGYIESQYDVPGDRLMVYRLFQDQGVVKLWIWLIHQQAVQHFVINEPLASEPNLMVELEVRDPMGIAFSWPGHVESTPSDVSLLAESLASAIGLNLKIR